MNVCLNVQLSAEARSTIAALAEATGQNASRVIEAVIVCHGESPVPLPLTWKPDLTAPTSASVDFRLQDVWKNALAQVFNGRRFLLSHLCLHPEILSAARPYLLASRHAQKDRIFRLTRVVSEDTSFSSRKLTLRFSSQDWAKLDAAASRDRETEKTLIQRVVVAYLREPDPV